MLKSEHGNIGVKANYFIFDYNYGEIIINSNNKMHRINR